MKRVSFSTRIEAMAFRRIVDKAMGMPVPPTRVGVGGWMDNPPGAERWTTVRKIKGEQRWVVTLDPELVDLATHQIRRARLKAVERSTLDSVLSGPSQEEQLIPGEQPESDAVDDDE